MNFNQDLDIKKDLLESYKKFWNWFQENESIFFKVVKERENIEEEFFVPLESELKIIKDGFYFLTGMLDENTVDLIFTAESKLKNIVFVEELVKAAPKLKGWDFKALKPATDITDMNMVMNGYEFNTKKINFYPIQNAIYPDTIEITIIHQDFNEENQDIILNGVYIFLDNYLGELNFATSIDILNVIGKEDINSSELIPIEKLPSYIIWRRKEYVEKYEGLRESTDQNDYSLLKAQLPNGNILFALMNTALLNWDRKASHPYITVLSIDFEKMNGTENDGLPNEEISIILNDMEDVILEELKDVEGNLYIGRETSNNTRDIYFASKDFRKPSKVMYAIQHKYADKFELEYDIYIDKYWQSFERFMPN